MRKKHILFYFILIINLNSYSQKGFIHYDKIKVKDITLLEEKYNSKEYESELEYVESAKDSMISYGKLKYYIRPVDKYFGKIRATYFYLKKDSLVRKIDYDWIAPKNSNLESYRKEFHKTINYFSKELNLPIGEQGKISKKIEDNIIVNGVVDLVETNEGRVSWETKDFRILIIMIWTEKRGAYLSTSIKWNE